MKTKWRPIETAPKDGTHFLAWCIDTVNEYDEDGRLIVKNAHHAYSVVAYFSLFGLLQWPYTNGFVQNREYTHWMPLPAPPAGDDA